MYKKLFTSESVTEGHPDKLCDQISDAVLDEILREDPAARVACETTATTGLVLVMGEISTSCYCDIPRVARRTIREIGYTGVDSGFDADTCAVMTAIDEQSPDIAMGVDRALEAREGGGDGKYDTGAGDQGLMFGFACDDTPEYMPLPASLANSLAMRLAAVRKNGTVPFLRPDGKTQVTVEYEGDVPVRCDTILISTQHAENAALADIREALLAEVIPHAVPARLIDKNTRILVNPTGRFVVGGPHGDTGLTGRKIIGDTYGGYARHGGGAFSGKDPTKVDRSAAYAARHIAKNLVAAGVARKCEVQLAYAIGVAHPVSIMVDTFGTGVVTDTALAGIVAQLFDLRPAAIIERYDLRRPIYRRLAAYGHFGRPELDLTWEKLDVADAIRKLAEKA